MTSPSHGCVHPNTIYTLVYTWNTYAAQYAVHRFWPLCVHSARFDVKGSVSIYLLSILTGKSNLTLASGYKIVSPPTPPPPPPPL